MTAVFSLAIKSLRNRRFSVFLTVVSIALSVTLLLGVELVKDRYHGPTSFDPADTIGLTVPQALMRRGVISRAMPESDIIGIAPPFCITAAECDQVIGALKESVVEVLGEG